MPVLKFAEPVTPGRRDSKLTSSPLSPVPPSPFSPSLTIRSARRETGSAKPAMQSRTLPPPSPLKSHALPPPPQDPSSSVSRASETFFTALDSPPDPADTTGTAVSSPIETKEELVTEEPQYRKARSFPVKLEMKTEIPLEEGVDYAVQFLTTILSATAPPKRVYIPPPKQLSLLATYAIHPKYTSHPEEVGTMRLSSQAMQYLRSVLRAVGPVEARLDVAFAFKGDGDSDPDSLDDMEPLQCALARGGSIWQRAPSFWDALGWAFNCSVSFPRRWKFWKAWMELMVEVLEADWSERACLDVANLARSSPTALPAQFSVNRDNYPILMESILYKYKSDRPIKELLRALMAFADGDNPADRGSFNKVFSRELAAEKTDEQQQLKLQKLDLENDIFGDYAIKDGGSSEDDAGLDTQPPRSRKRRRADTMPKEAANPPQTPLEDRVAETVQIRLRLFELLSRAYENQDYDMMDEFYVEFGIRICQLPLEVFRLFIRPRTTPLSDEVYISLLRYMVVSLTPKRLDYSDETRISLAMCEKCFVPFAAGRPSVEDNAKLALVLEAMLQHIIAKSPGAPCPQNFRQAVEKGIAARRDKTKPKMRGGRPNKLNSSEQAARKVLERSEENLRMLVDMIEDVD